MDEGERDRENEGQKNWGAEWRSGDQAALFSGSPEDSLPEDTRKVTQPISANLCAVR